MLEHSSAESLTKLIKMLKLFTLITLIIILQACAANDSIFELSSNQSMLMTGKGPGQDGAINPYFGTKCLAVVKSLSSNTFEVRIQSDGEIIEIISLSGKEKKEIILEPGYELYLDTDTEVNVKVTFKQY